MNWAVYVLILLQVFSGGVVLSRHGEHRKDKYNFVSYLVSTIILFVLYFYTGMFN